MSCGFSSGIKASPINLRDKDIPKFRDEPFKKKATIRYVD